MKINKLRNSQNSLIVLVKSSRYTMANGPEIDDLDQHEDSKGGGNDDNGPGAGGKGD